MATWDEAVLRGALGERVVLSRVRLLSVVESTQDEIRLLAESGAPTGTAVAAAGQRGGRGRLGRRWESPSGEGLYLSVLHRTRRPADELPRWSLGAAAAAWEACRATCDADVRLKWPNDLLCGGRKIGGILIESWGRAGNLTLAVGVGLNVFQTRESFPESLHGTSTSLALEAASGPPSREALLAAFLKAFDQVAGSLEDGDWDAVRVRWGLGAGPVVGRRVNWTGDDGTVARGRVESMTERGTLMLREAGGDLHEAVLGESVHWAD